MATPRANNLRDHIRDQDRLPIANLMDKYVAEHPKEDTFYLKLVSKYLRSGGEVLGRPFDTNRTLGELKNSSPKDAKSQKEAQALFDEMMKRLADTCYDLEKKLPAKDWVFTDASLKQAQATMKDAKEIQTLQNQMNSFQTWAQQKHSKEMPLSKQEVTEMNQFLVRGFAFNSGNSYVKTATATAKNDDEKVKITVKGNFAKRLGGNINDPPENLVTAIKKEIYEDKKGLGEILDSVSRKQIFQSMSKTEDVEKELKVTISKIKKQSDFIAMDYQSRMQFLDQMKINYTKWLTDANKGNLTSAVSKVIDAEITAQIPLKAKFGTLGKKILGSSSVTKIAQFMGDTTDKAIEGLQNLRKSNSNRNSMAEPEPGPDPSNPTAPESGNRQRSGIDSAKPPTPEFDTRRQSTRHQMTAEDLKKSLDEYRKNHPEEGEKEEVRPRSPSKS